MTVDSIPDCYGAEAAEAEAAEAARADARYGTWCSARRAELLAEADWCAQVGRQHDAIAATGRTLWPDLQGRAADLWHAEAARLKAEAARLGCPEGLEEA